MMTLWRGITTIVPWLWLFVILVIKLILTAVVSLIVGIPEATDRIAREIQEWFFKEQEGRRRVFANRVYWIIRIITVVVILLSWVCYSYVTVFLVMLLI